MKIGILCSLVRKEEKLLFDEFRGRGLIFDRIDDREIILDLHQRRWDFELAGARGMPAVAPTGAGPVARFVAPASRATSGGRARS